MSGNLISALDIKNAALKLSGELIDGTSDYDTLSTEANGIKDLELVNQFYKALHYGGNELNVAISDAFDWLKNPIAEILTIVPKYNTGTIAITNGSASATLSGSPSASLGSFAGRILKLDGITTIYRVLSHSAGSASLTLDQVFLETTVTAATYYLGKTDYALSNQIARIYKTLRINKQAFDEDNTGEVHFLTEQIFDREYPLNKIITGSPSRFTIVDQADDILTLRFNRFPETDSLRIEVPFIPRPEQLVVREFLDAAVNAGSDYIDLTQHGLKADSRIRLSTTGTLPAGLSLATDYFVIVTNANRIQLSATLGGAAVDITAAAGGGTHSIASVPRVPLGYRDILYLYAAYYIMLDKSDDRAASYLQMAQAKLQALVSATRRDQRIKSKNRGRLIPRRDDGYPRKQYGPRIFDDIS